MRTRPNDRARRSSASMPRLRNPRPAIGSQNASRVPPATLCRRSRSRRSGRYRPGPAGVTASGLLPWQTVEAPAAQGAAVPLGVAVALEALADVDDPPEARVLERLRRRARAPAAPA